MAFAAALQEAVEGGGVKPGFPCEMGGFPAGAGEDVAQELAVIILNGHDAIEDAPGGYRRQHVTRPLTKHANHKRI